MSVGYFGSTVGIRLCFYGITAASDHTDNLTDHFLGFADRAYIHMDFYIIFGKTVVT